MIGRLAFWVSAAFWLVMMAMLVRVDVLPNYIVEDNPGYEALLRGVESPIVREMDVYQGSEKVGTSTTTITPASDGTYTISNGTTLKIKIAMIESRVQALLDVNLDKQKELDKVFLNMSFLGKRADLSGVREGDKLKLSLNLNGQVYKEEFPYENGIISSYFEPFALGSRLKVGQVWHTRYLDPLSQKFQTAEVKVVGRETLEISLKEGEKPRKVSAYKIVTKWGTTELRAWATDTGVVLKEETPLGYTLVYRENDENDTTGRSIKVLRREMRGQGPQSRH